MRNLTAALSSLVQISPPICFWLQSLVKHKSPLRDVQEMYSVCASDMFISPSGPPRTYGSIPGSFIQPYPGYSYQPGPGVSMPPVTPSLRQRPTARASLSSSASSGSSRNTHSKDLVMPRHEQGGAPITLIS